MADPKKPVDAFTAAKNSVKSGGKKTTVDPFTAAKNTVKGKATPKAAEPNPIVSAGQAFLGTISAPLAGITGFLNEAARQDNAGKFDITKRFEAGKQNFENSVAGKETVFFQDYLKTTKVIGAKGSGAPLEEGSAGAFIAGLAGDILLDPTNLIPGKLLVSGAKVLNSTAKQAVSAAADTAISGEVSVARAVKGLTEKEAKKVTKAATPKALVNEDKLYKAGYRTVGKETPAAAVYSKATEKLSELRPQVVKMDKPDSLTQTLGNILGSAFDTGVAAFKSEVVKETALSALGKAAKVENRAVRKAAKNVDATFEGAPGATVDEIKSELTPLVTGKAIEFPKFTPYKAENGKFYVSTGEKAYSFPSEETARAYIASTGETAAKTVAGADPIFDTAVTAIPLPSMLKIPTTTKEAKSAQKTLDLIQSLAKTAQGTVSQGRGKKAQVVDYKGFTDLIAGLKAGHSVDYESLNKIIDALDPSRQWTKGVEGLSQKKASEFFSELITTAGIQTAAKVQERLDLMNAHTILKGQGVAFSDFAATYLTLRLTKDGQKALAEAVDAETLAQALDASRTAAQKRLYEAETNPPQDSLGDQFTRVGNAVNFGLTKRIKDFNNITAQEQFWEGITNMGDLGVRNTEDAWDAGSRAILKQQLNQSYQAGLIGSLLGLTTYRAGKKAERLKTDLASIEGTPQMRMLRFIKDINLAQDMISSVLGSRLVHIRVQDPNFSKQLPPNFVYLHLGDLMGAFSATGKSKLMEEAFFPVGAGIERTTDSMSYSGVVEAARHILELQQLNKPANRSDVIRMILSRSKDQVASTAEFNARADKLAEKMADHLLKDTRVAEMLTQTHKSRLIAAADEALTSAETLTRDLFDNLVEATAVNLGKGVQSDTERIRLLRDLFEKFTYLSGAFKKQSTEVGESVLRAAAMVYINDGKLKNLLEVKGYQGAKLIETEEELARMLETLTSMYKVEGPAKNLRKLNPTRRKATNEQVDKIINDYAEARIVYDRRRSELAAVTDAASQAKWKRTFDAAQKTLDTTRTRMEKIGYPTKRWTPQGWIASEDYNEELVKQAAGEASMLDTPMVPQPRALSNKQYAKIYEEYVMANVATQISLRASDGEEAATQVLARLKEIEAQRPDELGDQAQALYRQYVSATLHAGETKVNRLSDKNMFRGEGKYGSGISPTKLSPAAARSFLQRSKETWNATSGREESYALLVEAQSRLNNVVQSASRSMQLLINKYVKVVGEEDFFTAFAIAAGKTTPKNVAPEVLELAGDLRMAIEAFFGPDGAIATSGLDGKSIQAAFERFGLSRAGVPNVGKWKPEKLQNLIHELPFGKAPRNTGDNAYEIELFKQNRELLKSSGKNVLTVMSNMIQAIEHAKMEKHIVQMFHNEFSFNAQFAHIADPVARYNKAVEEGWVKIELLGGTTNLAAHLPTPENGGLYHPSMAKEFASVNREYNRLYNSKQMPLFVQGMMELTNILKFTQTVLNPRHHVMNNIGDYSAAAIGGARGTQNLAQALRLSMDAAIENGEIDYAAVAKWSGKEQFELSLAKTQRLLAPKSEKELTTETAKAPLDVVINGRRVAFDTKTFIAEARARGIIVGQQLLNDLKVFTEGVQAIENSGPKRELFKTVLGKARQGIETVERPLGDLTAAYGNAPRLWTAISEMKSRSWASEQEMWNALSKKVHTLHPTVLSLSSFERRYPRIIASYYTWIRGAHNAFIYMALNHTAAMTVYSKAQYNAAETQGLDPASIGTPWSDKAATPGYLDYSVYGPTQNGPLGPVLTKPGILPLDVIDTWNVQFDPTIPLDEGFIQNAQGLGQSVLGKNVNFLVQPGLEFLTKTDPATGKPSQIKDLASLGDKAASLFGPTQLLKGIGLYTPANKGETAANPLTQRQRDLTLTNWLGLTQKAQDVNSPSNVKNAQSEESARQTRILEQLLKNQGQP
jgi:hypothetical protein